MKHRWLALSCAASMALPLLATSRPNIAWGQQTPPEIAPPQLEPATQPAGSAADYITPVALGREYESQSAGISFRPPADCRLVDEVSSKYIAEWTDPAREWTLKLGKMVLDRPVPLVSGTDNFNKPVEGLLDRTVANLKVALPGMKLLRQDLTNTHEGGRYDPKHPEGRNNVGLIAIRYTSLGRRRLSQQAIIRASDDLYYLLTLTSPAKLGNDEAGPADAVEAQAVSAFGRMVDSVRMLDRTAIKRDQDTRLYNTRAAFPNWTPARLHNVLVGEQWIRILRDGKDIGYTYVTEDTAGAIPRPLTQKEMAAGKRELDIARAIPGDGILIGVRARIIGEGMRSDRTRGPIQTDSASWFFVSADKRHEDFSRVVVTDDRKAPKKGYIQEFGVSEKRVRRTFEQPPADPNGGLIQPNRAPIPVLKEDWELDVSQTTSIGMAEPLNRKLPPWYIPQAITHLVPRLLPLQKPQGYLFATYVSDAREVMMRYVDVMPEQSVALSGQIMRAVPIHDRLGLQGSPTIHYMTPDGVYLGSENKEQKLLMLPTDAATLQHIWHDANLSHPGGIDRPGPNTAETPASPRG